MDDDTAIGQVFNVGSNQEISIGELAKKVKELTKSESDIVFVPYDEAYEEGFEDMPRRIPDISKAKKQIGFQPQKDLEGILKTVIDFHTGQQTTVKV
jgi:UDP-glucose 4-epimerase